MIASQHGTSSSGSISWSEEEVHKTQVDNCLRPLLDVRPTHNPCITADQGLLRAAGSRTALASANEAKRQPQQEQRGKKKKNREGSYGN